MEAEGDDVQSFLRQVRTMPLSQEMVAHILHRIDTVQAAAYSSEIGNEERKENLESAAPQEEEKKIVQRLEQFSFSPDSQGSQVNNQSFGLPNEEELPILNEPSNLPPVHNEPYDNEDQDILFEDDSGEEMPRFACIGLEDLQKKYNELSKDYKILLTQHLKTEPIDLIPQEEEVNFIAHCNGEDLESLNDNDLTKLEKRLKASIEKIHEEKEKV